MLYIYTVASDKKRFNNCIANWEALHDQKAYSVLPSVGRMAILCSYIVTEGNTDELTLCKTKASKELRIFRKEALSIADICTRNEVDVELVLNASADDFRAILRDPTISDIITIGHGSLSRIHIPNSRNDDTFDWEDVARTSDHLKLGSFTQRHCGALGAELSVPYGVFAMSNHSNVWAPVGAYFAPRGLLHPHDNSLHQVTANERITYEEVKQSLSPLYS